MAVIYPRPSGGIGRRRGLKPPGGQPLTGSSPVSGTIQYTIIRKKMNDILLDPPPSPKASQPKPTTSAMRKVGMTMLGLGVVAFFIGLLIASLTN